MSERRPHWDDQLVTAVIHEIGVLRPSPHSIRDTAYAVIAAVEDWARWEHVPKGTLRRLEQAEAAIARVRELCEQTTVSVSIGCRCYTDECSGTCGAGRPLSWHLNPAAVIAALDGDGDE